METPKSPKKRSIRLQVINEAGSMTTVNASRGATVNELIELLTLGARDIIPNAPNSAIQVFLKKSGAWNIEVKRDTTLSEYKQLTKKAARIKIVLDPDIMKRVGEELAEQEKQALLEEEAAQAKAAERGQLDWNTLGYARLLDAREQEKNAAMQELEEKQGAATEGKGVKEGKEGQQEGSKEGLQEEKEGK